MKMSEDISSPSQKFSDILDEMKELGNFKGVLLSTRDGGVMAENIGGNADYNEFAAMCASVLESAEGLGKTFGVNKIGKIIAELEEQTIVIVKCDTKSFLAFIIEKESNIDIVFDNLTTYYQKIIDSY